MNRVEELTLRLADGEVSSEEIAELHRLTASPEALWTCIALLETEALLRGLRTVDVVGGTMARLITEQQNRVVSAVMAQIPAASPVRPRSVVAASLARRRRRGIGAAAVLLCAVVLGVVWVSKPASVPCGELGKVSGEVWIQTGPKRRAAKTGDVLQTTERLGVGFESSAEVTWLAEDARFTANELSEVTWPTKDVCELRNGSISAEVVTRAGKKPLLFKTADATAKITGTKFSLHRAATSTQLRVSEGTVWLADAGERGSADVAAGQFASASDAAAPIAKAWPGDGSGIGLLGEYYNHNYQSMDTQPPAYERLDARVRFQWGMGAPTPVTQAHPEHFGVRWTGFIEPRFSESYTFLLVVDDGARLWIDDRKILDAWDSNNAKNFYTQPVELRAGQRHKIRLEYCERTRQANVSMFWQSLSQPLEVVPQSQLHPPQRDGLPPLGELRTLR